MPGLQVSNLGRVRSARGPNGRPLPAGEWRVCRPSRHAKGYRCVSAGSCRTELIHRLVLGAFADPCPPGLQARHRDGDRGNNRADNLAWGTPRENAADTARHGRVRGQRLTAGRASELRGRLADGDHPRDLAAEFGVAEKTVRNIAAGGAWAWLTCA
ncbi:MAG: hypothetical protein C0501_28895 [Isosphaera sp.]|nr:hypothetical protein [Isosphaera sp.]